MNAAGIRPWSALVAELARETGVHARLDQPLAPHTTMRAGGPADVLAIARSIDQLVALVAFARRARIPWVVLGRGSNLVVADAGIRGLVILDRAEGCRIEADRLTAEAGLPLARAATAAAKAGLSGLEFGIAIPGTVGGAVWANAGAHGSDVAAVLETARVLGPDGAVTVETPLSLRLAYRDSRLKPHPPAAGHRAAVHQATQHPPAGHPAVDAGRLSQEIVLEATFHLAPAEPALISDRLAEIRRWRRDHQPLTQPSAGSFFRNPPGDSAGRLIEAAGLKGLRAGGASVSLKHANFIVNDAHARAADIRRLAETVRARVARDFGVELVYEVQFLGDWPPDLDTGATPPGLAGKAGTEARTGEPSPAGSPAGAQEER